VDRKHPKIFSFGTESTVLQIIIFTEEPQNKKHKKMDALVKTSSRPYDIEGNVIDYGKKHITVRSPIALKRIIDAQIQWTPIAEYKSRVRNTEDKSDVMTYFTIKLRDDNYIPAAGEPPKTFDLQFLLPESFGSELTFDTLLGYASLDQSTPGCRAFVEELNELLLCWYPAMFQKVDDPDAEFNTLSSSTLNLKWPWKKSPIEEYFTTFDPTLNIHKLTLGVGYHSSKNNSIGISIQLSNFSAPTKRGALLARKKNNEESSKKRKVSALDADGNEVEESEIAIGTK
jgi:hypothetical protein